MAKNISVQEMDGFLRQLKWVIAGGVVFFVLPLAIYAFYLERRFESFEDSLLPSLPEKLPGETPPPGDLEHLDYDPVDGQLVYVPAYSHVYHGNGEAYLLTVTLSVRNTSLQHDIVLESVRYFNTKGVEVKAYLDGPVRLPPLGTTEVVVERDDAAGGSGANFLVRWYANRPVTKPIIEAIMIDTKGQQGISFVRRGEAIGEVSSQPQIQDLE